MNTLKTTVLFALLTGILVAIGGAFWGSTGAIIFLGISLIMNFVSYWFSDSIVLKMYNAREVSFEEGPELYTLVNNLASKADLPMPKLYIVESATPNAFATGRNPSHAAVAVTTGILEALNEDELAGVIAHELGHIKHRDILISTLVAAVAGMISMIANIAQWAAIFGSNSDDDDKGSFIGLIATIIIAPLAATIIQMAISRSREYAADKTGGEICGDPRTLARALEKIDYFAKNAKPMQQASKATAHMCIINPFAGVSGFMTNIFSTHPQTEDRIKKLNEQATEMGIG